jgi:hypothetical protein
MEKPAVSSATMEKNCRVVVIGHWSGKCQYLQNHDSACKFKVVTCSVDGCNHTCRCSDTIMHQLEVSVSFSI